MSYQKKMQMLDEANKQTKALSKLGKWLRNIKMISTIFFIISYFIHTRTLVLLYIFSVLSLSLLPRENPDHSVGVYRCKRVSPAGCS